ncbi:hypothetical protein [Methylobacterium oryzae]|uniref:hypothetical protein n=1 Tax=Methylobacterium oryzae TaxID=334852 RepID=UPI001F36821E|nr:hypothetical protein [Methylobacterium oryzae]UIN38325.1 hypothetical protein LXM90_31310 [Methylobacterium oryzae]
MEADVALTPQQHTSALDAVATYFAAMPENVIETIKLSYAILTKGRINAEGDLTGPFAFSLTCLSFGFLFVVLEFCVKYIRHRSIFKVAYGPRGKPGLLLAVPLTAAIVGLLGFFLDLLQPTRAASVAVGIAWPAFLTAFFNTKEAEAGDEDPDESAEDL